jgi:hypothetical protein
VAEAALSSGDLRPMRIQLVADAGAALVALLAATALSVYKPQGVTPYGRRKQRGERGASPCLSSATPGGTAATYPSTPLF